MNALIMRLNSYSGFIPIFYDSLVEVGRCCEIYSERLEFKKDLGASILEYNIHSPRKELCRDIISRIVEIKKIGLGYWDEFLKGRLRVRNQIVIYETNFSLSMSIIALLICSKYGYLS